MVSKKWRVEYPSGRWINVNASPNKPGRPRTLAHGQWTGADFKQWRLASGLSQFQVAHRLGVAQSTVASWENGRAVLPKDFITKARKRMPNLYLDPRTKSYQRAWTEVLRRDQLSDSDDISHIPPSLDLTSRTSGPGGPGQALRQWRLRWGLTQAELAFLFDTDQPTISTYERGEKPLPKDFFANAKPRRAELVPRLARLLQAPTDSSRGLEEDIARVEADQHARLEREIALAEAEIARAK